MPIPATETMRPLDLARRARQARYRLQLLRPVLDNEVARNHSSLVDSLASNRLPGEPTEEDALRTSELWGAFVHSLACLPLAEPIAGLAHVDRWGRHLLESILVDDNPAGRLVQSMSSDRSIPPAMVQILSADLDELQWLFKCDSANLAGAVARLVHRAGLGDSFEPLPADFRLHAQHRAEPTPLQQTMFALARSSDWKSLAGPVLDSYRENGNGIFAQYRAFRWSAANGGELEGIFATDPIRLSELIGYDTERRLLLENTAQFVAGFPANNVLLYGDRGTGKSSTVKALFNEFQAQGLRLIEVPKNLLTDFTRVIALLRDLSHRFILFVDDLSFGESETDYTELKALLEGGLEARPANVLLYATSNRRHLIQEQFSDRTSSPDDPDPRRNDTLQQKLSLSDRFGITVTFLTPNQELYLTIVEELVRQRGLVMERDELQRQALQWASWHNGRSGRTARQFVDHLAGRMAFEEGRSQATTHGPNG